MRKKTILHVHNAIDKLVSGKISDLNKPKDKATRYGDVDNFISTITEQLIDKFPDCESEIKNYIDATIAEIDGHTEKMEELFKADKPGKDKVLYEIIINSYERHRNTLKRIQKMIDGEKVESGLYTLSAKSEMDMIKDRLEKLKT